MRDIPFYHNRPDNQSCSLAVDRSVIEYFTGKQCSWSYLEKLSGFRPGKAAWTIKAWTELAEQGYDICMIEAFDYERFYKDGQKYLRTLLSKEELDWQLKNTNILEIKPLIPKFLKAVKHIKKSPKLHDIDELLEKGYLVKVMLDSCKLNGKPGYEAHSILVFDKRGDSYIAHDPGGLSPGKSGRNIPAKLLYYSMGGDSNTVEVTGIKR